MNVTFLIGNGFDINLGLKTKYSDFLHWYVKQNPYKMNSLMDSIRFDMFKTYLLENVDSEWWSDIEKAMGVYLGDFTDSNIRDYYFIVRDIKIKLSEYLTKEQEKCNFDKTKDIASVFKRFLTRFDEEVMLNKGSKCIPRNTSINYHFINFNYTNTLKNIINCTNIHYSPVVRANNYYESIQSVIHVHGTLDSSIIMGVNDESQLMLSKTRLTDRLRRTMIKSATNSQLGRMENTQAEAVLSNSDVIVIFGMSIGATDQKWWAQILEWLQVSNNHKVIWFTISPNDEINPIVPEDLLDYVDDKQNELLNKMGANDLESDYYSIKEQIYIIRNTELLKLADIVNQELVPA